MTATLEEARILSKKKAIHRVTVRFSENEIFQLKELIQRQLVESGRESSTYELKVGIASMVREAVRRFIETERLQASLLSIEDRLASSIIRAQNEIASVHDDSQLIIGLLDQLVHFALFSTPEVLDKEFASATGQRRYTAFVENLKKTMVKRGKKANLSEILERKNEEVEIE